MRFAIAFIALIVVANSLAPKYTIENVESAWETFKTIHGKTYSDFEEESRKETFKENYAALIEAQHEHYRENRNFEFTKGVSKFFDLTREEFAAQYLRPRSAGYDLACDDEMDVSDVSEIPDNLDYRALGKVAPIKNQGNCGSCWAFSAVSHIESAWAIRQNSDIVQFAEQQLVDCDKESEGCNGGWEDKAINFYAENGAAAESDYVYRGRDQRCQQSKYKLTELPVKGCLEETSHDEQEIKKALVKYGPLAIAVNAYPFFDYSSGVVRREKDCQKGQLNHAINIVGYGVENDVNFWIVRNSWGTSWGEEGYIRLEIGKNLCNIGDEVTAVNWSN